jgi:phage-related protein (TIGR01555 family)
MAAKKRTPRKPAPRRISATDTMRNLVSNLGTDKDKATHGRFVLPTTGFDRAQLEAAYRTDWIARKIIDIPPQDATREWRAWQAEDKQIEQIEAEEKRLGVQKKLLLTLQRARLYGGAVLLLGMKDGKHEQPLDIEKVKKGDLAFVHSLSRNDITPGDLNRDVLNPFHGEPVDWQVSSEKGQAKIHPSRVLRFIGREIPSLDSAAAEPWGDSVLMTVDDSVKGAGAGMMATSALVQEAKIDVVKIPNLTAGFATTEFENSLISRFQLANVAKSLVNTLILDKEEEWDRIEQNFSGLPDIIRLFLLVASGAADIPATRMLGQSPAGLSATGESDLRNYYDGVKHEQVNTYQPILERLDEVLIRSALGSRPEEIYYDWRPLWQLGETEKADIGLKKAQTFQIDMQMGTADIEVLCEARRNQLVEDGVYPGLEAAVEEMEAEESDVEGEEIDENDPEAQAQFAKTTGRPTPPGAPGAEVPQDTALNGAQITALAGIVKSIANKEYPPETGIQLIMVGFPTIKEEAARKMVDPLENFEPPPPPVPFGGTPGQPPKPGQPPVPPKKPGAPPPDPEDQE